ncbi:anthranilate phosphoribosyltransferase [Rhodobacter sp. JA431]|uniref:glycosyl transferase family protein n=1 Tax=Rhodobacter sp. JA431 TaxID=570013 RepID=UPI000BD648D0|nr:glycosyl transferase family protein [Rhodobacter sp. JA431]SOC18614.1 anthranilate phosphoribosyltransferase [Rhodobacter sp. JA431]
MSLAPYIHALGRGPGRSRALTQDEARDAMAQILAGTAAPEAVGALLMLMRYRGETAPEIAGFVEALRATLPAWPGPRPVLDWPSYAAGRSRGLPWFLLSARLVARAGLPVLLHGWNGPQAPHASIRAALPAAGIAEASDMEDAARLLTRDGIAYLPLEAFAPRALEILRLREILGLRSAINTVLRVMNPAGAPAAVQGVFHPPYRELQADACALLGQESVTVIKGGGGEFERHPSKKISLFGLRAGASWTGEAPALYHETRRLAEAPDAATWEPADIAKLWLGERDDPFAEAIVRGTAELALQTCGFAEPGGIAQSLWDSRADPM